MTYEELIAYANENYKPGVLFNSVFSDRGVIREIDYYFSETEIKWRGDIHEISAYNGIKTPLGSGLVASPIIYKKGKWAPIVSYEIY